MGLDDLQLRDLREGLRSGAAPSGWQPHKRGQVTPKACASATSAAKSFGADTLISQIAGAYAFSKLYGNRDLGAGETVGVIELARYSAPDVASFQACYGTKTTVTPLNIDGGPAANSNDGEANGDIETVLGLAPRVSIDVYQAPNTAAAWYGDYQSAVCAGQGQGDLHVVALLRAAARVDASPRRQHALPGGGDSGSDGVSGDRRLRLGGLLRSSTTRNSWP